MLGVLPGIVGSLQANEALKLALGDRRAARRPPAPLRRARDAVHRDHAAPRPGLPGLRRPPDDHRLHRLRRVLRRRAGPGDAVIARPHPADASDRGGRRARGRGVRRHAPRGARRPRRPLPRARNQVLEDGDGIAPVRERLPRQRGRAHAPGPRHARARRLDRDPAPRDGRRRAHADARPCSTRSATRRSSSCRGSRRTRASASTRSSRARTRPARSRTASPRR